MEKFFITNFFLVLVWGGGSTIGLMTLPGQWYEDLLKPSFNPPNWVFAPAWTFLYVLIAVAGSRTWIHARKSVAMKYWFAQLFFNFLWSPVFFGAQRIDLALGVVLLLLASIVAYIASIYPRDKISALLFLPYLAWVAFATVLNFSVYLLN